MAITCDTGSKNSGGNHGNCTTDQQVHISLFDTLGPTENHVLFWMGCSCLLGLFCFVFVLFFVFLFLLLFCCFVVLLFFYSNLLLLR